MGNFSPETTHSPPPLMAFDSKDEDADDGDEDDAVRIVRINALKSYCMMLCMLLCITLCMT